MRLCVLGQEILVLVRHRLEIVRGFGAATQGLSVLHELDIAQTGGDAAVAVAVVDRKSVV